jgi:hypothetical protein
MEHPSKQRQGTKLVGPVKLLEWAAAVRRSRTAPLWKHREMTDQSTITMWQSDICIRQVQYQVSSGSRNEFLIHLGGPERGYLTF